MKKICQFPLNKNEIIPGKSTRTRFLFIMCVEVHFDEVNERVLVRDTKDPDGPHLEFFPSEWEAFIEGAKNGEFDLPEKLKAKAYEQQQAIAFGRDAYAKSLGVEVSDLPAA